MGARETVKKHLDETRQESASRLTRYSRPKRDTGAQFATIVLVACTTALLCGFVLGYAISQGW